MKPEGRRPFAGYLVAFALGMLTMAIIGLVMRMESSGGIHDGRKSFGEKDPQTTEHPPVQQLRAQVSRSLPPRPGVKRITPLPPLTSTDPSESPQQGGTEPEKTGAPETRGSSLQTSIAHSGSEEPLLAHAKPTSQIFGHVTLEGQPPPEKRLPLDAKCSALFQAPPTTRFYALSRDKGLADVFIVVSKGVPKEHWPPPKEKMILKYENCFFEPYIFAVRTGQPITVQNRDEMLHNLHVVSSRNSEVNHALLKNSEIDVVFKEPEVFIKFKCDVHPWEFAYGTAVEHPFYDVTDKDGNFGISELPAGEYEIEARHRKAGILRKRVTVRANENSRVDFTFQTVIEQMSPRGRAE